MRALKSILVSGGSDSTSEAEAGLREFEAGLVYRMTSQQGYMRNPISKNQQQHKNPAIFSAHFITQCLLKLNN